MKRTAIARRTPLSRSSTPMERRTRLAPESRARRSERGAYRAMRSEVFERDGHTCQAASLVPETACGGPLDPQHVIPRSAWAGGRLVAANVTAVCRRHHEWIDANPHAAAGLGLHGWSWSPRPEKGTSDG